MTLLIMGLAIFLGAHSVRIFADGWRTQQLARLGLQTWKGIYAAVSITGFALIVWGYGAARAEPMVLWNPPIWTRHLAAPLTLLAFILLAAANIPGTRVKAAIGHPMVVGVKAWALGHLVANGTLADVVLFGSFLVWAIAGYSAARRRDRATGTTYPTGQTGRDASAIVAGLVATIVFALWLHGWLIGVPTFG